MVRPGADYSVGTQLREWIPVCSNATLPFPCDQPASLNDTLRTTQKEKNIVAWARRGGFSSDLRARKESPSSFFVLF